MKITVLTHPPAKNYGGILQALALTGVLAELGHECSVLYGPVKKKSFFKRVFERLREAAGCGREKAYRNLKRFVRENLPVTEPWYGKTVPESECFIVGSDQVWRPAYTPLPGAYFLDFLPPGSTAKKIAYAASFGVDSWEFSPAQTEKYGELLRKFDAVSVREKSGISLCRENFGCEAVQMPDPTLLHDAEFWRNFAAESKDVKTHPEKGTCFTYFLDPSPEKNSLADSFAASAALQRDDFMPADKKTVRRPVGEFISGIDGAKFVLTDSFHGMVFSMILGKPFAVTGNLKRGMTRFSLTAEAGIPEVVLTGNDGVEKLLELYSDISRYEKIKTFLKRERERGRQFLTGYLS